MVYIYQQAVNGPEIFQYHNEQVSQLVGKNFSASKPES